MLSTSIEEIVDKFLKRSLYNCQHDYVEDKSNGFWELKDLHRYLEEFNENENKRIVIYQVMHSGSEIHPSKHIEEQKLAVKFWVGEVLGEKIRILRSSISCFI